MTLLAADSFNRADSAVTLGTTNGAGTLDPLTWVQQTGTFGITTNAGRMFTTGPAGHAIATVETSQANIDASLKFPTLAGTVGLCVRFLDINNYWVGFIAGGATSLYKRVAASFTQIGSDVAGGASGDTLRFVTNGSAIQLFRNGVSVKTTTDSFNSTATKHGFWLTSASARVDDFSVSDLVVAPTSVPYVGAIPILS